MSAINTLIINRPSIGGYTSRAIKERIINPLSFLKEQHQVNFTVTEESDIRRINLSQFKYLLLSRPYSQNTQHWINEAKCAGIKIIVDLDDLPIFRPTSEPSSLNTQQIENFLSFIQAADIVICSTDAIYHWVKSHYKEHRAVLIETGYNFGEIDSLSDAHRPLHKDHILFTNAGPLKLGTFTNKWIDLMSIFLSKTGMRLAVYADYIDYFPQNFPLDYFGSKDWLTHKIEINSSFPLAVAPLVGEEDPHGLQFSQYKTPTKFICYSGLGIPTIYSKTPIYESIVRHNYNGFLACNEVDDWTRCLEQAIENRESIQQTTIASSKETRERFDITIAANKWLSILQE